VTLLNKNSKFPSIHISSHWLGRGGGGRQARPALTHKEKPWQVAR